MNNFVEQRQGPPMIMDEIPRTYYPGRGFLTDQEAYPTDIYGNPRMPEIPRDIFNRAPRYSGGLNIPGAPGNIQTLPYFGELLNPTQMPYYPGQDYGGVQQLAQMLPPIDPASHRNQMKQKKIYEKGKRTDNPYESDAFLRRTGPQLPLAQAPAIFDRKYVS